jgi:hypothetical protein
LRNAIERVIVGATKIEIRLNDTLAIDGLDRFVIIPWTRPSPRIRRQIIEVEAECSSTGRPMRVRERHRFLEAVRRAHRWLDELTRETTATIESLAVREGRSERSIRMNLSLAFVSPTILAAAIDGRLPRGFSLKRLMDLPMAWSVQWTALHGFPLEEGIHRAIYRFGKRNFAARDWQPSLAPQPRRNLEILIADRVAPLQAFEITTVSHGPETTAVCADWVVADAVPPNQSAMGAERRAAQEFPGPGNLAGNFPFCGHVRRNRVGQISLQYSPL